jgi:hypothetical protein
LILAFEVRVLSNLRDRIMAETMAVLGSGLFVDEPLLFVAPSPSSVFAVHNVISQKTLRFPPADFHHHARQRRPGEDCGRLTDADQNEGFEAALAHNFPASGGSRALDDFLPSQKEIIGALAVNCFFSELIDSRRHVAFASFAVFGCAGPNG